MTARWHASNLLMRAVEDYSDDRDHTDAMLRLAALADGVEASAQVAVPAGDLQKLLELASSLAFQIGDLEAHWQES